MNLGARLWQVFWLGGAALVVASAALIWGAEGAYAEGNAGLGALYDVARIVVYLVWFVACWKASRHAGRRVWTYAARAALVIGLAASAMLY